MRPRRLLSVLSITLVAMLLLAACGGNGSSASASASNGSTASTGSEQSAGASPSAEASSGGGGSDDLSALADKLVPPNSSQTARTEASGVLVIAYTTSDSVDSLKGFYDNAIKSAGLTVVSTTTVQNGVSIIFTKGSGSAFGGSVAIGPASDTSGSAVVVSLGQS